LTVVLFYKNEENRKYSDEFKRVFAEIEETGFECKFGVINIDEHSEAAEMASQTKTPINYVPYVVIYAQGRPYMSYGGKIDSIELVKLITYVQLMQTVTASLQFDAASIVPMYIVKGEPQGDLTQEPKGKSQEED
jgi:glutaredoxin